MEQGYSGIHLDQDYSSRLKIEGPKPAVRLAIQDRYHTMGTHLDTKKEKKRKERKKHSNIRIHTGKHGRLLGRCILALNEVQKY